MTLNVFAIAQDAAEPFVDAGHRIEFVKCDRVYAAVERIADRPVLSESALRTQHGIVAQIARRVDALLPARFGSVVDLDELTRLVARRRDAIQQALDLVRGRDQMTVRLFTADGRPPDDGVPPKLQRRRMPDTTDESETGATGRLASGTAYLEARRIAAHPVLPADVASITDAVRGLVIAERAEPGQGRIAATVYHLVDRTAAGAYRSALEGLQSRLEPETLTVSGPWPPFAFVPDLWQ